MTDRPVVEVPTLARCWCRPGGRMRWVRSCTCMAERLAAYEKALADYRTRHPEETTP